MKQEYISKQAVENIIVAVISDPDIYSKAFEMKKRIEELETIVVDKKEA